MHMRHIPVASSLEFITIFEYDFTICYDVFQFSESDKPYKFYRPLSWNEKAKLIFNIKNLKAKDLASKFPRHISRLYQDSLVN